MTCKSFILRLKNKTTKMELIHTYRGARELKHIRFGFDDEKEFINRFNLSIITAKKLCNYLEKNNKVVDMTETYDPQSGWSGFNFIIGDQDLSVNGFCFSPERVDSFLINNKDN